MKMTIDDKVFLTASREYNPLFSLALCAFNTLDIKSIAWKGQPIVKVSNIFNSKLQIPQTDYQAIGLEYPMDSKYCMVTCYHSQAEIDGSSIDSAQSISGPHATIFTSVNNKVLNKSDIHWTTDIKTPDTCTITQSSLRGLLKHFRNKSLKTTPKIFTKFSGIIRHDFNHFLKKFTDHSMSNEERVVKLHYDLTNNQAFKECVHQNYKDTSYIDSNGAEQKLSLDDLDKLAQSMQHYVAQHPQVELKLHFYFTLDKVKKISEFSALTVVDNKHKKPSLALTSQEVADYITAKRPISHVDSTRISQEVATAKTKISTISQKLFECADATVKIQAAYRGYRVRKSLS
jgi:hypothetical protein